MDANNKAGTLGFSSLGFSSNTRFPRGLKKQKQKHFNLRMAHI